MSLASDDARSPLHKTSITNNNHIFGINESFVQSSSIFKNKSCLLKVLVTVVVLLLIILAVVLILFFAAPNVEETLNKSSPLSSSADDPSKDVCLTKNCVLISARIIESMNHNVDPCNDFYEYACGGWIKKTPIPESRTRYSRFEKLSDENSIVLKEILNDIISKRKNVSTSVLERAANYYKSCMDTKQIEKVGDRPVKEVIKSLGSWPVTDPLFNSTSWSSMDALVAVHKNISMPALFQMFVTGDIKNSNENIIVFDQAGILLDRESYLKNTTFHEKHRKAYRTLMKETAKELGADERGLKYIDAVFDFEVQLANITMSVLERRDYRSIYETMTLRKFAKTTEIPEAWLSQFVGQLFKEAGGTFPMDERIVSYNTKFVREAFKLFNELPKDVQASYIVWHAVKIMAPIVLGKYQDISDNYATTAFGTTDRQPRWQSCISSTLSGFGNALARPFVKNVYDKKAKDMSTEMIQAIKQVFIDNLDSMDWMDTKTRIYAKKKAGKILENIGYPDFILNDTALEKEYEGLNVVDGSHFLNYMTRRKYENLKNYAKREKPVDKSEWGILPTMVNAYYAPTENKIGFPAGILQWPFYDSRAPRAVSYGAIGMVVGHEISHGFDDQGKDFTIEGNLDTWWTNKSEQAFANRSQCFSDQYSKFTMFGKNMNGKQTLGEDLADNGGLRQSLQAYRIWKSKNGDEKRLPGIDLNSEQLYFLAFAQVWCTNYRESAAISQIESGVHSLSRFRVIGTLQNSDDFSQVYKCPSGSIMNPRKKCCVW